MKSHQLNSPLNILLADDDKDDCFFFQKALKEISIATHLTIVHDGEELMQYLLENSSGHEMIDVIFLDLSMPRKTGFECLTEIKENDNLKYIPIVVFTTSFARNIEFEASLKNTLSSIGADEYLRKPGDYEQLKRIIQKELSKLLENKLIKQKFTTL